MAIWDRFKKKDQSVLPEEVKQYYQSEQRQRAGVAVLLGIVALVITVLVATGLFYGGRYAYRQINKDTNQTAQQQEQTPQTESTATPAENSSSEGTPSTPSDSESTSTPTPAPATSKPAPATSSPPLGDEEPLPHTGDPGL